MYMRNRYYNPLTGAFTQTDPIGLAGGVNTYGYAEGNPATYSDPYGLTAEACPPAGCNETSPATLAREVALAEWSSEHPRQALAMTVTAAGLAIGGLVVGEGLVAASSTGDLAVLRQEYVTAVNGLRNVGQQLLRQGFSEESVGRTLYSARRTLGVLYKQATPWPNGP
jgi:uncharacterized protein RhaS with RHS repeats